MADLHNILDGIDDGISDDEEEEIPTQNGLYDDPEDDVDRQQPAALEEFEQRQQRGYREEDDNDEDVGEEDDAVEPGGVFESYIKLKRMWQQELSCPELLPFDEGTINEIQEQLVQREKAVEDMGVDAGDVEALLGSVLKVDADRAKFMLNDLLRTRIWKIQEHPLHMRDLADRMSDQEIEFLKGYGKLVENHLRRTVLDHVSKDALKNLDEPEMIDTPDLEQYVFVNIKETCEIDLGTEEEPNIQQHDEGATLITRYNVVRELFIQGKVDLIL